MSLSADERKIFEEFLRIRRKSSLRAFIANAVFGASFSGMSFLILWGGFGLDPVLAVRASMGSGICVLIPIMLLGIITAVFVDSTVKRVCDTLEAEAKTSREGP